jgi:two-component system phosphate regulon sensor histidine kinase PhoR
MPPGRLRWAIAIVAVAGAAAWWLGGVGAALAAWLGGGGAVLLLRPDGRSAGPAATVPVEPAPPLPQPLAATDAVLDALPQPVLLTDHGRVVLANAAAVALLGRHVVGQDARLSIRHPDAAPLLAGDDEGGLPADPVLLGGLGSIDQLWELRAAPTAIGLTLLHLTDHTAERAADRMRTDFVANASHELRTPLASILGYVETLQGEAGEEPPLRARFLRVVLDESRRMQRLVQDLMSLSRIEADRFRLPTATVDLGSLVERTVAEVALAHPEVAIELDAATGLPPIVRDPAQLAQLVHNLIGNARAYGTPGAPIAVRLSAEAAGDVQLAVADRGDGIAAEHLPRLTERFYRVDAGRSRGAGGTGLGLAIVKHIVERHRGRLLITSTPGVGTTVSVAFPATASAAASVTEP